MANAAKKTQVPTEVATQEPRGALTAVEHEAAKSTSTVLASDVLIPRLLLMQGISPLVAARKAQIGDFIRSTTGEKLGDPEHPVEVVPLKMINAWIMFEDTGQGQPEFRGMIERDASNEQLPWEYEGTQGEKMFRRKAITLFALVPSDVAAYNTEIEKAIASGEAPDLDRTVLPVVITFQSTAYKYAGKKCASFFNNVEVNRRKLAGKMEIAPFQYLLTITAKSESDGKNTWFVTDMLPAKKLLDPAVREEAARWVTVLGQGNVKVDDSGEVDQSSGSTGSTAGEMEV